MKQNLILLVFLGLFISCSKSDEGASQSQLDSVPPSENLPDQAPAAPKIKDKNYELENDFFTVEKLEIEASNVKQARIVRDEVQYYKIHSNQIIYSTYNLKDLSTSKYIIPVYGDFREYNRKVLFHNNSLVIVGKGTLTIFDTAKKKIAFVDSDQVYGNKNKYTEEVQFTADGNAIYFLSEKLEKILVFDTKEPTFDGLKGPKSFEISGSDYFRHYVGGPIYNSKMGALTWVNDTLQTSDKSQFVMMERGQRCSASDWNKDDFNNDIDSNTKFRILDITLDQKQSYILHIATFNKSVYDKEEKDNEYREYLVKLDSKGCFLNRGELMGTRSVIPLDQGFYGEMSYQNQYSNRKGRIIISEENTIVLVRTNERSSYWSSDRDKMVYPDNVQIAEYSFESLKKINDVKLRHGYAGNLKATAFKKLSDSIGLVIFGKKLPDYLGTAITVNFKSGKAVADFGLSDLLKTTDFPENKKSTFVKTKNNSFQIDKATGEITEIFNSYLYEYPTLIKFDQFSLYFEWRHPEFIKYSKTFEKEEPYKLSSNILTVSQSSSGDIVLLHTEDGLKILRKTSKAKN